MPIIDVGFPTTSTVNGPSSLINIGPTLWVDVGYDMNFNYANAPALARPTSQAQQVPALIDTGASESCIDEDLARQLQLPLIDKAQISGVGGAHTLNVYWAHIDVPALSITQYGRFTGVHLGAGGQPHKVLIGRTFLSGMMLVYDGRTGLVQIAK